MFITGPKVIETVTGEKISSEDLGGAFVHNAKSGNAHFKASSEEEALDLVRKLIDYLPANYKEKPEKKQYEQIDEELRPDLTDIVPYSALRPYDVKK